MVDGKNQASTCIQVSLRDATMEAMSALGKPMFHADCTQAYSSAPKHLNIKVLLTTPQPRAPHGQDERVHLPAVHECQLPCMKGTPASKWICPPARGMIYLAGVLPVHVLLCNRSQVTVREGKNLEQQVVL
jgi:hypothetical protein